MDRWSSRVALVSVAFAGCGDPSPRANVPAPSAVAIAPKPACEQPPSPSCTEDGWCLDNPWPASAMLRSVWGSGPNDVWAVGDQGLLLHWDGAKWTTRVSDHASIVLVVWGSGPSDVYAVTDGHLLLHYDGRSWSTVEPPFGLFGALWGSGPSDVWAGGRDGHLVHFDGKRWATVATGVKEEITSLWGTGPNDVYLGGLGVLGHWDGKRWSVVRREEGAIVYAIGGSGPSDVFASWGSGTVLHFDGKAWTEQKHPGRIVSGIWAAGPRDVFATAGDRVLHFDGTSWSFEPAKLPAIDGHGTTNLNAIWGASDGTVFAVGWDGVVLQRKAGKWSHGPTLTLRTFGAVWGSSPDDAWAGSDRTLLHYDGCAWSDVPTKVDAIQSIGGTGPRDVFVVGASGAISHFDGKDWRSMESGTKKVLFGVWARGPDEVYAVGEAGTVLRFDHGAWSLLPKPADVELRSLAGIGKDRLLVSTMDGSMYQWNGTSWSARPLQRLGSGVFTIGDEGLFLDRGGGVWRDLPKGWTPLGEADLAGAFAASGTSLGDVYTVGSSGRIQHWDGKAWAAERSRTAVTLRGVWAHPELVVAVGDDGTILRKDLRKP